MKTIKVTVSNPNTGIRIASILLEYDEMMGDNESRKKINSEFMARTQYLQEHQEVGDVSTSVKITEYAEPELLIDSHHGIHVPSLFASKFEAWIRNCYNEKDVEEILTDLKNSDNESYWDSWDDVLGNLSAKVKDRRYILHENEGDVWFVDEDLPNEDDFGYFEEIKPPVEVTTIVHQKTKWWLKKIDSTHFYMINKELTEAGENPSGMSCYHVGQVKEQPYYADVEEWLQYGTDLKGKNYD